MSYFGHIEPDFSLHDDHIFKMPYRKRKRTTTAKRYTKRRRPYRIPPTLSLTQEKKFIDSTLTDLVVSANGTVITVGPNLIAQDTTENGRIGRKVIIRSIAARFIISLPVNTGLSTSPGGDVVRCIILWDKQANGAYPAIQDYLDTAVIESYRNLANAARFITLFDEFYAINRKSSANNNASTSISVGKEEMFVKFYKNVAIPIEFEGQTGNIEEITTNNIVFMYISDLGIAGVTAQKTRLRYFG